MYTQKRVHIKSRKVWLANDFHYNVRTTYQYEAAKA